MEAITAAKPWEIDFTCLPNPWSKPTLSETVPTIGILRGDGIVNLLPPIARALDEAKAKLLAAGIEVIEMDWVEPEEVYTVSVNLLQLDGGKSLDGMLKLTGEPYIQSIIHNPFPFPFLPAKTLEEYFAFNLRRSKLCDKWLRYWNGQKTASGRSLDAILCPLAPFPVTKLDMYDYDNMSVAWNLLDYPAAVFPVTKFDQSRDVKPLPAPISDHDKRVHGLWTKLDEYGNIPINLQLVGKKNEDSKLMHALEFVDAAINLRA
jgi:amidase